MNINYRTKYEGEIKTLKLKANPLMHGLGCYEDHEGKQWDVRCVIGAAFTKDGKPYINARLVDVNNPYYSTGSDGHQNGHHVWKPYYFKIIN